MLEGALDEVGSLTTLTGDLLLLARGGHADLSDAFEVVSLAEVTRAAVERSVRSDPGRPAVRVEVRSDALVMGSPELLTRAVGNLIDNSLHHTPESGTVVVAVDGDAAAAVRVVDSGVGMTPGARQHAFDRFWRADESRSQPGHGLGLALVRQIMTAHGGHATISETPGGGTTVSLAIPRWTGGSGESPG